MPVPALLSCGPAQVEVHRVACGDLELGNSVAIRVHVEVDAGVDGQVVRSRYDLQSPAVRPQPGHDAAVVEA